MSLCDNMGTITGICDLDPVRWPNSHWQSFKILENVDWHEQFPFRDEDFQRFDESSDLVFYESPRFVTHIDDLAIAALTKYYKVFPPSNTSSVVLLDMCNSWISHFPLGYKQERIVGTGLNEEELKANKTYIYLDFAKKIKSGMVQKQYIAKVVGEFPEDEQVVNLRVNFNAQEGRNAIEVEDMDENDNSRLNGKAACTKFTRICTNGKYSIVSYHPITGRTYQVRMHTIIL
ncbi:S-adenosyl-L-methionine-dependent methyltransferases superfamily protein [Tanacetum coccineum]